MTRYRRTSIARFRSEPNKKLIALAERTGYFDMGFSTRVIAALAFLVTIPFAQPVAGQDNAVQYRATLSVSAARQDTLPLWQAANQFGVVDRAGTSANLRLAAYLPPSDWNGITYSVAADVVGRVSEHSSLFLQQMYGEARYGNFLLRAGRKEETAGVVHPSLSLGSTTLGTNAAPITKVSLSWPEYVTVPGTGAFVGIKGYLGHGWLGGNRVVDGALLHEKNVYLRLGFADWPIKGWGGIMHYVTWGGTHVDPEIGRLPSGLDDYLRVFFVQGASEDSAVNPEITNVLGNSLGAYHFGLDLQLRGVLIRVHRQFYLEDTVSLEFRNALDGLWGLSLTFDDRRIVTGFLYEHVNTIRQSSKADEPRGTDNYYNHFLYATGWTHRGQALSLPVVSTNNRYVGVYNNILLAHHLGLEGTIPGPIDYRLLFTYSRNYGAHSLLEAPGEPRIRDGRFGGPVHQRSLMLEVSHAVGRPRVVGSTRALNAFTRLAYDWGDLLPDSNLGITVGLTLLGSL
ncbi:MAG: capsule assembly Wzi family protein [Rhodothermia bacterium]|nr:capsule assembly Wzi family protein [Rhodothermia bacterium]